VNQLLDWSRPGSLRDVHVAVLDLRGNTGLPTTPGPNVFESSSVTDRVLLNSVDYCASIAPRFSKADYGPYVGTQFYGTPCP
jgi:hypothetical protein